MYKSSVDFGCLTLQTLIFIDVTLLPGCPPGLTLSVNESKCTCYSILTNNVFQCSIQNKIGYLEWKNTVWVNPTFNGSLSSGVVYNCFCPRRIGKKLIDIGRDPSKQCDSNQTGILCGACMLGVLNALTIITWHFCLSLVLLASFLYSWSLHST